MYNEQPLFFLNSNGKKLFGILSSPDNNIDNTNKTVVICCRPIFNEFHQGYRVVVNYSRYIVKKGCYFFRFDYFGDGDSEGRFEDSSISSRVSDILSAIDFLKEHVNPLKIFLSGIRMGGSLSLLTASKTNNISGVIAWSPIVNIKKYVYDALRINLSNQMVVHKKIIHTREELVEKINNGLSVNLEGYHLCNPLWNEANSLNLLDLDSINEKQSLIIQISPISKQNKELLKLIENKNKCTFFHIKDRKFWIPQKIVYSSYAELFKCTVEWIENK